MPSNKTFGNQQSRQTMYHLYTENEKKQEKKETKKHANFLLDCMLFFCILSRHWIRVKVYFVGYNFAWIHIGENTNARKGSWMRKIMPRFLKPTNDDRTKIRIQQTQNCHFNEIYFVSIFSPKIGSSETQYGWRGNENIRDTTETIFIRLSWMTSHLTVFFFSQNVCCKQQTSNE